MRMEDPRDSRDKELSKISRQGMLKLFTPASKPFTVAQTVGTGRPDRPLPSSARAIRDLREEPVLEPCLISSLFHYTTNSGRVAKEVMESSAKIKREPPEIHR